MMKEQDSSDEEMASDTESKNITKEDSSDEEMASETDDQESNDSEEDSDESNVKANKDEAPIAQQNELSLPEFRQRTDDLVKELQDLPDVDDPETINEQGEIIAKNIRHGSRLMKHVGTSDTAKLQCTLRHIKICMELSDRKFRRSGTAVKPFNVMQYIDLLVSEGIDSRDDYREHILLKVISADLHSFTTDTSSFISLLGVIDLNIDSPDTPTGKTRTHIRNKYALTDSQLNATQHQIVNSKVSNGQKDEDDSLSISRKIAEKLKNTIVANNVTALGLYEYGLQDGTDTTHKFVANVFGAASLARDGFARIIDGSDKVTDERLPYANWKIQDATPPPKTKKNTSATQRFQQIISFNATTFRTLMEVTSQNSSGHSALPNGHSKKKRTTA